MKDELLHVIAVVSNPVRFKSRYKLFRDFQVQCTSSKCQLWVIECAYGDRPFEITHCDDKKLIQVRTHHELWHKENMINIAISRLPPDWKYVAWVDADVSFSRSDWAKETVHQLQHYKVVQMFSHAIDLGPEEEPVQHHEGFVYDYWQSLKGIEPYSNLLKQTTPNYYYYGVGKRQGAIFHPGYAWAARREAIDALGGLMEFPILGAGDHHMARAFIGDAVRTVPKNIGRRYKELVGVWQDRSETYIKRDIGYVPGTLFHHWHGPKRQRYYTERWKILTENNYDPDLDIKKDSQGLLQLTDRNIRLRDGIRLYFRARNEDGVDL